MDELSAEEILELRATYGVGLVVPIHLVNNSFGGAAVYETDALKKSTASWPKI